MDKTYSVNKSSALDEVKVWPEDKLVFERRERASRGQKMGMKLEAEASIVLWNPTGSKATFKLKTNAPKHFLNIIDLRQGPSGGEVGPGQMIAVRLRLKYNSPKEVDNVKVLVQTALGSEAKDKKSWDSAVHRKVSEVKLRCFLAKGPDEVDSTKGASVRSEDGSVANNCGLSSCYGSIRGGGGLDDVSSSVDFGAIVDGHQSPFGRDGGDRGPEMHLDLQNMRNPRSLRQALDYSRCPGFFGLGLEGEAEEDHNDLREQVWAPAMDNTFHLQEPQEMVPFRVTAASVLIQVVLYVVMGVAFNKVFLA